MATDRRHSAASQEWWDQYNLGRMGVYTGSIANDFGMQYGGQYRQPAPPVIAPAKRPEQPAVYNVPAGDAGESRFFSYLGNGFLVFFGIGVVGKVLEAIRDDPACVVPYVVVGMAAILSHWCWRRYS